MLLATPAQKMNALDSFEAHRVCDSPSRWSISGESLLFKLLEKQKLFAFSGVFSILNCFGRALVASFCLMERAKDEAASVAGRFSFGRGKSSWLRCAAFFLGMDILRFVKFLKHGVSALFAEGGCFRMYKMEILRLR